MRFFKNIENTKDLFYKTPTEFDLSSDKSTLSYSLGAALYMSSLRENLLRDLNVNTCTSAVICMEDSISDDKVEAAEANVLHLFSKIEKINFNTPEKISKLPLIFLRVRNLSQLKRLMNNSALKNLCGFVFPKFEIEEGSLYFKQLAHYNKITGRKLYGMPIIETENVINKETRINTLSQIKSVLKDFEDLVLNVRIGGTDFSGLYGLRRDKYHTIYDLIVVKDCISDIINIFKNEYVISAAVNEYFDFKKSIEQLGIFNEIKLDIMNGLIGKTVIHPNQVNLVNSMMVVSKEDYMDARSILSSSEDGVIRSIYSNKMNEIKPHTKWARNIIDLSKITGVFNDGKDYRDLLYQSNRHTICESLEDIVDY